MVPDIFKEYDIRGVAGRDLSAALVGDIGRAFVTWIRQQGARQNLVLAVGRDVRPSSPALSEWLVKGLCDMGVEVLDLGVCPTPLVYFSLFHLPVDGAVMVTGSHLPRECNGFKLCHDRTSLHGRQIQEIRQLVEAGRFHPRAGWKKHHSNIVAAYQEYHRKRHADLGVGRPRLKVVIDAGNGTAGLLAPQLFRDLHCEVTELFCEPDGAFPHHHPDPTLPGNLQDLVRAVTDTGADLGFGFGGDAGRLGVVDERGVVLGGDEVMIILARDLLSRHRGAAVIGGVTCSSRLFREVTRAGGRAVMWKTGHSLIRSKMREEHALLAGEMNGHFFLGEDHFGYDDAIHAALQVAAILHRARRQGPWKMSDFLADLPAVQVTPEIRTDCPEADKAVVIETVRARLEEHRQAGAEPRIETLSTIDGVRAEFARGWGMVRASTTQPVLVSRFEAETAELLQAYRAVFEEALAAASRRETGGG